MPDVVRVGGAALVRTREANGTVTYRPVDVTTGAVVDAAAFEARKQAEQLDKLRSNPAALQRSQREWEQKTRANIAKTRVDAARKLRRAERERAERESGTTGPRRRARDPGASAKVSSELAELREEMRVAEATGLAKKNPGRYSFVKAALEVEEAKHAKKVEEARKAEYARARSRKGVRGDAGLDDALSSGDDEDKPVIRGSLEDLNDPDYRRGPAPTLEAAKPRAAPKPGKGAALCRKCKMPGHFARDCMADPSDVTAVEGASDVAAGIQRLEVQGKVPPEASVSTDPDYSRELPVGRRGGDRGRGGRGRGGRGRGKSGILVFDKNTVV